MRAKIAFDLREYATEIRQSKLVVDDKVRLLDQIDELDGRLDEGCSLGLFRWWASNDAVRELIQGDITADEVRLLERELEQVGKRLK